jgi:PAS domain S-box-containing protein
MGLNLPDGSRKWIDINAEPMFLEDSSKPSGVVVTFQDITEKRRLDQELRESERKFRTYVDQAAEAFFAHDFEGKFLDVNQRACDSVGYSRDELMAMTIMDISFNFDLPAAQAQWRNLHPGRSSVQTGWQRRKDGSIFPVEAKLSCYRHLDSILFIVLVQDLTERHRIEQEKLEMEGNRQRMLQEQSLNRLTGAVAHHFNNQLQAVMMALENATLQLPASSQTNEILILAMSAASEAADISRKMNTYLGESHRPRVAVDLAKFIRDFLPILESSKPIGITVSASFSLPGPIIQADVDLLEQAFSALFLNASEACLQKEGRIGICVKTVPAKERPKTRFWPSTFQWLESTYACLEVRDNGVGISQESTLSVFEPFYSTKFAGRGLGLATALGAAIAHQGSITVESQLDRGSVFRIFFPIDRN